MPISLQATRPLTERLANPQRKFLPSGNQPALQPQSIAGVMPQQEQQSAIGANPNILQQLIQILMGLGGGNQGVKTSMTPGIPSQMMSEGLNNTTIGGSEDFRNRYRMI